MVNNLARPTITLRFGPRAASWSHSINARQLHLRHRWRNFQRHASAYGTGQVNIKPFCNALFVEPESEPTTSVISLTCPPHPLTNPGRRKTRGSFKTYYLNVPEILSSPARYTDIEWLIFDCGSRIQKLVQRIFFLFTDPAESLFKSRKLARNWIKFK